MAPAISHDANEIRADAAYPLDEFMRRIGAGRKTIAAARRQGLEVRRVGRRSYVTGKSWLAYLDQHAKPVA